MENAPKARRGSSRLTAAEWCQIVNLYERGQGPMMRIAERFGVSRQAIWAGLKKRGAVKDCRLDEFMAPFVAALDRQAIRRGRIELARHDLWMAEQDRQMAFMDHLMTSTFAAIGDPRGIAAVAKVIADRNVG